jgi:hypothetical protein
VPSAAEFRAADKGALSITAFGEDDISVTNEDRNLENFTFFTPSSGNLPQSGLGLGRNSTFLESLFNAGKIASRTWSLLWGLEGGDKPDTLDGSLKLGGYDKAKTTGPNIAQPFSSLADMGQCPSSFIVFIADIVVKHSNGTEISLFGNAKGTALRTCIKPDILLITFPKAIWEAFSSAIGGTFIGPSQSYKLWGMDYDTQGIFDGDLQFALSSGLELTVPNNQLVVPNVQIDKEGRMQIPNDTMDEILVYNLENSNLDDMPLLGQVFLTSVYMHVDNEREQFTLWQAKPTTDEDLVLVHSTGTKACDSNGSGGSNGGGTTSPPPKNSLSAGAIAGIVAGIILGLAAFIGLVFWYLGARRRRAAAAAAAGSIYPNRKSLLYDTHKEMTVVSGGHGRRGAFEKSSRSRSRVEYEERGPQEVEGVQVHEIYSDTGALPRYELDGGMPTR